MLHQAFSMPCHIRVAVCFPRTFVLSKNMHLRRCNRARGKQRSQEGRGAIGINAPWMSSSNMRCLYGRSNATLSRGLYLDAWTRLPWFMIETARVVGSLHACDLGGNPYIYQRSPFRRAREKCSGHGKIQVLQIVSDQLVELIVGGFSL